jgi:rhodanese-related sulfurtransferase
MNHMRLIAFLLTLMVAVSASCQQAKPAQPILKSITAKEAKKLAEEKSNSILLDVRTPTEWANGTLQGCIKVDYHSADFAEQIKKLDKSKPVFVYCAAGGRSPKASAILQKAGFVEVYNLTEGHDALKAAGFPAQ